MAPTPPPLRPRPNDPARAVPPGGPRARWRTAALRPPLQRRSPRGRPHRTPQTLRPPTSAPPKPRAPQGLSAPDPAPQACAAPTAPQTHRQACVEGPAQRARPALNPKILNRVRASIPATQPAAPPLQARPPSTHQRAACPVPHAPALPAAPCTVTCTAHTRATRALYLAHACTRAQRAPSSVPRPAQHAPAAPPVLQPPSPWRCGAA